MIKKYKEFLNEVMNFPLETKYRLTKSNFGYTIFFQTNKKNIYRLDLIDIVDENGRAYHIGFDLVNIHPFITIGGKAEENKNYGKLNTNKYEMLEILLRIIFIIKDLIANSKIYINYFCIGMSPTSTKNKKDIGNKKNEIYEYLLNANKINYSILKTEKTYDSKNGLYFYI